MVESGGLENRFPETGRGFESYSLRFQNFSGEMAELAEGARLLSECGAKVPPRVRIPVSPPPKPKKPGCNSRAFLP